MVPFTVTKSVTSRELSIAVESRDAKLVFGGEALEKGELLVSI